MKTRHVGSTWKGARHPLWASMVIIAASCGLAGPGHAATTQDLKTFNASESYLADGQTFTITQTLGQAVIQFEPAATQNTTPSGFIAPDNTQYMLEVDLTPARGLYAMQTGGTVSESANAAAIGSLNTDSRVKYAYPVFAAQGSGARRFVNDEIVVRTKAPIGLDDVISFQQLGLQVTETLSASENIHVPRLVDPKDYNPFSVCSALLTNMAVLWDEPNLQQEGSALFIPNDTLFASDQWSLNNTGQSGSPAGADVRALGSLGAEAGGLSADPQGPDHHQPP